MDRIGVGFVDLDAEGRFHFERLSLRPEFQCVAAWDASRNIANVTHGRLAKLTESATDVINHPDVALVWFGPAAPVSLIQYAMQRGKFVLVGLPLYHDANDWKSITSASSRVCVAALHRWDGGFRTVQSIASGEGFGRLLDVRNYSRQFVPSAMAPSLAEPGPSKKMPRRWFEMLDELLLIVSEPVAPSTIRNFGKTSERSSQQNVSHSLGVEFVNGCRAELELDRNSLAPMETGWILTGTHAGLANGRRYRASQDHELIDVPIAELPTDQDAFYNALLSTVRDSTDFPVTTLSIQRVLEVVESAPQAIS